MSYCTKDDVKVRLNIKTEDVSHDIELDDLIAEGESIVNIKLKPYTATPLATVPDIIKYAVADYAAAGFKDRRRDAAEPPSVFRELGDKKVEIYIEATFKVGKLQ